LLFGGDKENSLAFCNNSEPQKKRRQILQKFTLPHFPSDLGSYLDQLCLDECQYLVEHIKQTNSEIIDLKPLVTKACANIFNRYFCSSERRSYNNEDFSNYCQNFDQVFWEVNNGRAVDFLPWLMPIFQYSSPLRSMKKSSEKVRRYVTEEIIEPKRQRRVSLSDKADFLDSIMDYIDGKSKKSDVLTQESALYALEDILGGHSAVANIILRIVFDLALQDHQDSTKEVIGQIAQVFEDVRPGAYGSLISLEDRQNLSWVVASIHETIRMTCSPIVPHQATQDSTIGGYKVPKDTVIFVNNHNLNMSEELWTNPESYQPQRFLNMQTKDFSKPAHFQPFSMGPRSCMGYKMVYNVAFSIVTNLLWHFDIHTPQTLPEDLPLGMLALPPKPFQFVMNPVNRASRRLRQSRSVA